MKSEESKLGSVAAKTASKSEGPGSSPEMDLRQRKKSNSPASESPKSKSRPKFVLPKKTIVKKQNAKVKKWTRAGYFPFSHHVKRSILGVLSYF